MRKLPIERFTLALFFLFALFSFCHSLYAQTNSEKLVQVLDEAYDEFSRNQEAFDWEGVRKDIISLLTDEDDPADPDSKNTRNESTALHYASLFDDIELIRTLQSRGANMNPSNIHDWVPLTTASEHGRVNAIRELVHFGVDVNLINRGRSTPLLCAASRGHVNAIRELVSLGADPNLITPNYETALMYAADHGGVKALRTLIDLGASVNLFLPEGDHALAQSNDVVSSAVLILRGAVRKKSMRYHDRTLRLIDYVEKRNGEPSLHVLLDYAVETTDAALAMEILESVLLNGETCLHAAVRNHRGGVLQVLSAHHRSTGALESFINTPNLQGQTPLSLAVLAHDNVAVNFLLEMGATPLMGSPSPLHLARNIRRTFFIPDHPQSTFQQLLTRSASDIAGRLSLVSRGQTLQELSPPREIYGIIGFLMLSLFMNR